MICHVVLIRLKAGLGEAREVASGAGEELLRADSRSSNLRLGNGLGKKAEVDYPYALVMEFDDEDALQGYQVHPDHQRFVREVVDPIQDDKKVLDYWC
jgi:hypothetical protein